MTQFPAGSRRVLTGAGKDTLMDADELRHGIPHNPHRFWNIEHACRVLGYTPRTPHPRITVTR